MSSSCAISKSATAASCCVLSSRPSSSCLRSRSLFRRKLSIARCFAVAMSQAPGLSGMPDSGHCSRATTRASCASSSARPTSRTMRVRPAMILADSILQTASIARCVSVAVTATHHTIFNPLVQVRARANYRFAVIRMPENLLCFGSELFRPEDLANFRLALPPRPVFFVQFHKAQRPFDGLFFRLQLKDRIPADNFLGLGEGSVDLGYLSLRKPDARAHRGGSQPAACDHRAGFNRLLTELVDCLH